MVDERNRTQISSLSDLRGQPARSCLGLSVRTALAAAHNQSVTRVVSMKGALSTYRQGLLVSANAVFTHVS